MTVSDTRIDSLEDAERARREHRAELVALRALIDDHGKRLAKLEAVEFAEVVLSAAQSSNLTANNHVEFNTVTDRSWISVSTGSGQANGLISIEAGEYIVEAYMEGRPNTALVLFEWRDHADDSALADASGLVVPAIAMVSATYTSNYASLTAHKWHLRLTQQKTVKLDVNSVTGSGVFDWKAGSRAIFTRMVAG